MLLLPLFYILSPAFMSVLFFIYLLPHLPPPPTLTSSFCLSPLSLASSVMLTLLVFMGHKKQDQPLEPRGHDLEKHTRDSGEKNRAVLYRLGIQYKNSN